jgi:hypothetical protein
MLSQKNNPFSRYWRKKADSLWSKAIKRIGRCAYCGNPYNLQAHHLILRKNNSTRHKIDCGLCLCEYHHLYCSKISPHLKPKNFNTWLKKNHPEKYQWVQNNKYMQYLSKVDFKAAYDRLNR